MLKTNAKRARENIRKYIMENCCADNYIGYTTETVPEGWEAVKKFITDTFKDEKVKHNKGMVCFPLLLSEDIELFNPTDFKAL